MGRGSGNKVVAKRKGRVNRRPGPDRKGAKQGGTDGAAKDTEGAAKHPKKQAKKTPKAEKGSQRKTKPEKGSQRKTGSAPNEDTAREEGGMEHVRGKGGGQGSRGGEGSSSGTGNLSAKRQKTSDPAPPPAGEPALFPLQLVATLAGLDQASLQRVAEFAQHLETAE